jgi:type III pantothenate kinase
MILAFDIGNTNVAAGVFTPGRRPLLAAHWKLRRPPKARSGWWTELAALVCAEGGITPRELDGCAVCSVVPGATRVLAGALERLTGKAPLVVGGGLRFGVRPAYARPDLLGPDRLCAMAAAAAKFGAPLIVVDCGTAITVDGVARGRRHVGGMIAPGLAMSASALGRSTAALPAAGWEVPRRSAGADTVAGIRAGVWFAAVGGIRESVRNLKAIVGKDAVVVGTGGDAPVLMEEARLFDAVDTALVLEGAALAWRAARGPRGRGRAATSRRRGAKR